jgi:hypothetical protein
VPLALAFYAAMGAVAVAWRLLCDGQGPFFAGRGGAVPGGGLLLRHALLGLAVGGGLIVVSRLWVHYTKMGRALAQRLAGILGPLSGASVVVLALASGLGEEAFFRGALQPRVGLVIASLLFGLAHLVPRRERPACCSVRCSTTPGTCWRRPLRTSSSMASTCAGSAAHPLSDPHRAELHEEIPPARAGSEAESSPMGVGGRDGVDLDLDTEGEAGNADGAAGRLRIAPELQLVDRVHTRKQ